MYYKEVRQTWHSYQNLLIGQFNPLTPTVPIWVQL